MPGDRLPVTLCVSTRNAAAHLDGCLAGCADWVSEIVVVDMESEDGTREIAQRYGAHVIEVPNAGFAEPGRQRFIDAATQPWLLVLDADERSTEGLRELVARTAAREDVDGVWLPRRNRVFGHWFRGAGYWPDRQMRLFRRERTHWPPTVHTWAQVDGVTEEAPADPDAAIVHLQYDTIGAWVERNNRYTDAEVERAVAAGRKPSVVRLAWLPLAHFVHRFVRERGFRDGWPGLAVSLLVAINTVHTELKLWDHTRTSRSSS